MKLFSNEESQPATAKPAQMSQERQKEVLGEIRESRTGYAKIWNENGKTYFQTVGYDHNPIIEITQEDIDTVASGQWFETVQLGYL